jgi:Holliday junction resolvasome RuvABC ATP-dependent DNA helicase subunit
MPNIHKPFHQKYRPNNLDELVGQKFISITLKQALLTKKLLPHIFLMVQEALEKHQVQEYLQNL